MTVSHLRASALAALVVLTSCQSRTERVEPTRTSTAAASDSRALSTLRLIPAFAAHLRGNKPLREGAFKFASALRASVTAEGAERLALEGAPDVWIELAPRGVAQRAATVRDGIHVREDVAVDTDLVQVVEPTRMEEFRVLRSPSAPHAATWTLHTGPGVSRVEVSGGIVRVFDRSGRSIIQSEPAYAIDARGRAISVELSLGDREGARTLLAQWTREDVAYPLSVDPAWVAVSATGATARVSGAAALLNNGKLLVSGGTTNTGGPLSSAELYDPVAGTWATTGSMNYTRSRHIAVPLASGKVLVAGGYDATALIGELYDPATGAWTLTGGMNVWGNQDPLAARAGDTVVVANGNNTRAEVYVPASNTWIETGALATVHLFGAMASAGTSVIIAGGRGSSGSSTSIVELYNPSTNTWSRVADLSAARDNISMTTLDNGKVLLAGGSTATAELYDPVAKTWSSASTTAWPFYSNPLMVPFSAGRAFAYTFSATTIYDSATNRWYPATGSAKSLQNFTGGPLTGNRAMIVTGHDDSGGLAVAPQIFTLQPLGATCGDSGDCASLNCVDGVCCNSACTGNCQACNLTGALGTCSPVTGNPVGSTRTCGAFACAAGTCKTSCATDTDCLSSAYCSGGSCVPKKPLAATCAGNNQCSSNFCVDGVCCNTACTGQCAACNVTGSIGTCKAAAGVPKGTRAACSGTGVGTTCGQACDGLDMAACHYPNTSTPCSANACTAGKETHASTCDGAGLCSDIVKDCGVYACGTLVCKTKCASATDCAAGYYCSGEACIPKVGLGTACTDSASCGSGLFCTDGVCCGVVACDAGASCGGPMNKGTCTKVNGIACTADADCGSGICADGVCCNARCEGQCEACDVTGKAGTCSPVSGAPHGTRAKCDDRGTEVCKAMTCNGAADTSKCVGFASGSSVTCGKPTCSGASFTGASSCDGMGACAAPAVTSCVPYVCSETGCLTACSGNEQCTEGFECKQARCVAKGTAVCSDDGLSSVPSDAPAVACAPYRCGKDGTCMNGCETSADCVPGNICDPAAKTCVTAPAPTDDDGGCAMGRSSSSFPLLALALAALLSRRGRA